MYGKSHSRRAFKNRRRHTIFLQKYQNPRRGGSRRSYTEYHTQRCRRTKTVVRKNLSILDGLVRSVPERGVRGREYPLRLMEARAAHQLWENFTKLTVRRQCGKQTQSGITNGLVRGDQSTPQSDCASPAGTSVAAPNLCVSAVGRNEVTTPGIFRRQEWTLLAPYLTPVEFIRLSHTHKLSVPDFCWKQAWHHGKVYCYRTACRVQFLVHKYGAMTLAQSILTEGAAMRAMVALWQLGHTEACIALARFPRVHRLIVTGYRREKIRRNLDDY